MTLINLPAYSPQIPDASLAQYPGQAIFHTATRAAGSVHGLHVHPLVPQTAPGRCDDEDHGVAHPIDGHW